MSRTIEQKLTHAKLMLAEAEKAIAAADATRERAREMGGGLLSFGASGPQRARRAVQSATERGMREAYVAEENRQLWEQRVRKYTAALAEQNRVHLTLDDINGATHVRTSVGWHEVVRVNKTTVSTATGYSWVDRYPFDRILEVRTIRKDAS